MEAVIERIELFLLIAAVVSMIARRLRLPYTVGLVFAGIALSSLTGNQPVKLTRDLIFTAFLPPLIFEAAIQMEWSKLRREMPVVTLLATVGVVASVVVVACGLHYLINWNWNASVLLAVLLSATDPVAVIATFKDLAVKGRVQLLVESESLFNDGTAAVLFAIAVAGATGHPQAPGMIPVNFVTTTLGSLACGGLVAGLGLLVAGQAEDHLVEITFTTIIAFGSFLLAEHFHLSGVLSTLTAGILIGNVGSLGAFTDRGREAVESFWEYVAFLANSVVFLLIGSSLVFGELEVVWKAAGVVVLLLLAGRAIAVYGCCLTISRSKVSVPIPFQHVLFWGGLRGALALALALGLPEGFERRDEIIGITFAVVAFSVIVQGITVPVLLNRLGIRGDPAK